VWVSAVRGIPLALACRVIQLHPRVPNLFPSSAHTATNSPTSIQARDSWNGLKYLTLSYFVHIGTTCHQLGSIRFTRKRSLVQSQQRPFTINPAPEAFSAPSLIQCGGQEHMYRVFPKDVSSMLGFCMVQRSCCDLGYASSGCNAIPLEFLNEALTAQP
jgi:hypothetical protein